MPAFLATSPGLSSSGRARAGIASGSTEAGNRATRTASGICDSRLLRASPAFGRVRSPAYPASVQLGRADPDRPCRGSHRAPGRPSASHLLASASDRPGCRAPVDLSSGRKAPTRARGRREPEPTAFAHLVLVGARSPPLVPRPSQRSYESPVASEERNRLLCQTCPGSAHGRAAPPVLAPDRRRRLGFSGGSADQAFRVMGEDLVPTGTRGGAYCLVDRHCPHRGPTFLTASSRSAGLRCNYHRLLFDRGGALLPSRSLSARTRTPGSMTGSLIRSVSVMALGAPFCCVAYLGT